MFLKIFLFSSIIAINIQAHSSPSCETNFEEDSFLPDKTTPTPNEIVISNQIIRASQSYRERRITNRVRKWGENTLGRILSENELHLLETFYRESPSSEIKAKILRRRTRDDDQFNFSEREIKILSQGEIRLEFAKTVKIKIPKKKQEEKELKAQGFNAAYRRGMDEVNEWIAVREQLIRAKADPFLTHVDYFAEKMREYIVFTESGITTSAQVRNLNHLKRYVEDLIDKKQVTYYKLLMFSLLLSKVSGEGFFAWYQDGHFEIHHKIMKDFPNYMAIPTTIGEMGIIAMNKGSAHGIHPLGLIKGDDSLYFFVHDISHYIPDRSSAFIYTRLMEHTKGLPLEKRKNIELAYFILTHEGDYAVKISDPADVLSKVEEQIDMVLRPDNEELKGLIDVSHEHDKKVQTVIADFLGVYNLIQREIEIEIERRERKADIERKIEAESPWM